MPISVLIIKNLAIYKLYKSFLLYQEHNFKFYSNLKP